MTLSTVLTYNHKLDLVMPWASSFSNIINSAFLSYHSLLVFYSLIPIALSVFKATASIPFLLGHCFPGCVVLILLNKGLKGQVSLLHVMSSYWE